MPFLLIGVVVLLILWSVFLPFYKEKAKPLYPNEDKCFSPNCRTITIKKGYKRAMLFIHGFPTTPYMYSWATGYASEHGYDVYAPLIPTFGSDCKELLKTNFSSWFEYINTYYLKLREEYEELYVVGVSMGGTMTLKLAEIHSNTNSEMTAIAVLSSPVVYNSFIKDRIVTNPLGYFARLLKLFVPSIGVKPYTGNPKHNDGDEHWHGYKGIFIKQGVSLMYNFKSIRNDLPKISVPMLVIHERSDKTVPFKNFEIIRRETNTYSCFLETSMGDNLLHSHHALLSYNSTQKPLMDRIIDFFG